MVWSRLAGLAVGWTVAAAAVGLAAAVGAGVGAAPGCAQAAIDRVAANRPRPRKNSRRVAGCMRSSLVVMVSSPGGAERGDSPTDDHPVAAARRRAGGVGRHRAAGLLSGALSAADPGREHVPR